MAACRLESACTRHSIGTDTCVLRLIHYVRDDRLGLVVSVRVSGTEVESRPGDPKQTCVCLFKVSVCLCMCLDFRMFHGLSHRRNPEGRYECKCVLFKLL